MPKFVCFNGQVSSTYSFVVVFKTGWLQWIQKTESELVALDWIQIGRGYSVSFMDVFPAYMDKCSFPGELYCRELPMYEFLFSA